MHSIGLPWLVALVVIPLSIAAIGYGAWGPRTADGSNGGLATVGPSGAPKVDLAPLSIVRGANGITLSGNVPDDSAKAILLKTLKRALPAGVNIVDQIQLNPHIDALDFSHATDFQGRCVDHRFHFHGQRGHHHPGRNRRVARPEEHDRGGGQAYLVTSECR